MEVGWDSIASGGGLAMSAAIIGYLLTHFLPKIVDSFREELQAQRQLHETVAKDISMTVQRNAEEVSAALKEVDMTQKKFGELLIRHDATVRGSNDRVLGSHDELKKEWEAFKKGEQ